MQITMEALEQAFAPIEAVGKGEVEFKVNGTTATLRRLMPEEESEVQKYATSTDDDSAINGLEYIEKFKLAIISHALVAVGSTDLRDVQYVETGEKLDNGKSVKISRYAAMRKMLLKWAAPARIAMFRQYVALLDRVEDEAEKLVEFIPSNTDTEIERLEGRLAKLKERRDADKESLESELSKMVKNINDMENAGGDGLDDDISVDEPIEDVLEVPVPDPVVAPKSVVAAEPQVRRSSIPQAAKPTAHQHHTPPQAPPQAPPRNQQPNQAEYAAGGDVPDSFVDLGDSGVMGDAIQAENLRMLQRRQAAARGQDIQESPSVLTAAHSMRRPPHLAAREVHGDLDVDGLADEMLHTGRTVDGVETYRMAPPEEMASRSRRPPAATSSVPKGVNPRFQPPKKP